MIMREINYCGISGGKDSTAVAPQRQKWVGGLAEWTEEDNTAFLSVAFTWKLPEARSRALWYRACGYKVRVGGPAIFVCKKYLADVAEIGGEYPDAIKHHNPAATMASRGCQRQPSPH